MAISSLSSPIVDPQKELTYIDMGRLIDLDVWQGMLSRKVETGGKVVFKLYTSILLDDEFSRQQICGCP